MKPKTAYNTLLSLLILLLAIWTSGAGILMGPVTNPVNGHVYYLLTPELAFGIVNIFAPQTGHGSSITFENGRVTSWRNDR